jgi:sugar lactone lactonase YvrE
VVGQPDFVSGSCGYLPPSATSECDPYGVAFDSSGNLWEADEGVGRALQYPSSSLAADGPAATLVIGSSSLTSSSCTGTISATSNGSCLGDIREVAVNSSGFLFISDHGSEGVDVFTPTFSTGETGSLAVGGQGCSSAANTICQPDGLAFDKNGNLWVADESLSRVLEFTQPFSPGEAASIVIGQADFVSRGSAGCPVSGNPPASNAGLCSPMGLAFDSSGNLWVSDAGANRVLEFVPGASGCPAGQFCDGMTASLVVGTNGVCPPSASASSLCAPRGIAFDSSGNLWVADTGDYRVLEIPAPYTGGASVVLGQSDFTTTSYEGTTQTSVGTPEDLAFDSSGNLWVTDNGNSRVLEFTPSSGSSTSTSTTTLSTTTLSSCAGNSEGNGIFGVCAAPSSISTGGTVTITGYAFSVGANYVLNVTEPNGAKFATEAYSYSCSLLPCSATGVFPTDFGFLISGAPPPSTSQVGTYLASVCAYFAPRTCAVTSFTVMSSTTTSTSSTSTTSTSSSTSTSTTTTTTTTSSSTHPPVTTCPPCLVGQSISDTLGVGDQPGQGNVNLVDSAAFSDLPAAYKAIVTTLDDTVSAVDSVPGLASNIFSDGIHALDQLFQPTTVGLSQIVFQAHSPVNILVTSPGGLEAGFYANGTTVNQLGASLVGPNTEPESVTIPNPGQGRYTIEVFGKASAGAAGSAFTVTGDSVGPGGETVGTWSYSGKATPTSFIVLPVSVLSNGDVSTYPPTPLANALVLVVVAVVVGGLLVVAFIPGQGSVQSRVRRRM